MAATLAAASAAVINVGGGCSVTMLDVLDLAHEVTGRSVPVITAEPQAGDVAATEADLTLARRVLGYRPTVDQCEGIAHHADWLAGLSDPLRMSLLPVGWRVSR